MCSLTIIYRFNPYKSSCTLKASCGLHLRRFLLRRAESSRPTWCGNTSPATMPWVDIDARKANSHKPHRLRTNRGLVGLHGKHQPLERPKVLAERKATRHQQQFLNHPCARSEASGAKNKVLASLLSRSDSPKASRISRKRSALSYGI